MSDDKQPRRKTAVAGKPSKTYLGYTVAEWVGLVFRLILGVVLLVAGLLKVGDLEQSYRATLAYDLFDPQMSKIIGYALPIIEILVGALLIVGLFTRVSAVLGTGMMVAFIFGIASVWARGISLDCGCFGGGGLVEAEQTEYFQEILRDLALVICGLWLVIWPKSAFAIDNWLFAPLPSSRSTSETHTEDHT